MKFDDDFEDDGWVSRSQKKRDSTAAQKLGAALATLTKGDLETLDLPPQLLNALLDWKKFPGHEAKRRQMQFIGKLMRETDMAAIEDRLEAFLAPSREETKALHDVEALRDRLINAEDRELEQELAALAEQYLRVPVARLRHLAVTAKAERAGKKPPKAYRELFRLLRDITKGEEEAL